MNNKIKSISIWMIVLIILLALLILWALFILTSNTDKITVFGIVGIIITAITSVITVNSSNQKIREREYELMLMKEKQKVFNLFFDYIINTIVDTKNNKAEPRENDYIEFKKGLMIWGSDKIIKEFIEYDSIIKNFDVDISVRVKSLDSFLKSIRIELNNEVHENLSLFGLLLNEDTRKTLNI